MATLTDLGVLTALVSLASVSPRAASVPALLAGNVVMFFGQKHFAFRSVNGRTGRQAASFFLVQLGGFGLNALLYDFVLRWFPASASAYVLVRLATTNLVWLAYSFPLWHLVFRPSAAPRPASAP